jgi:hypothetical protein
VTPYQWMTGAFATALCLIWAVALILAIRDRNAKPACTRMI